MKFTDFDIFPKFNEEYSHRTTSSGVITMICLSFMFILAGFQFIQYLIISPQRLSVDQTPLPVKGNNVLDIENLPKLEIHFDIILHSMPCAFVNFGVLTEHKEENDNYFARVKLKRYSKDDVYIKDQEQKTQPAQGCGSCYGMKSGCCNTCKEVKDAFKEKGRVMPPASTIEQCRNQGIEYYTIKDEKCRINGTIIVPPDAGSFFISPADSYGERQKFIADYLSMGVTLDDFNLSHTIKSLYVGNTRSFSSIKNLTKIQKRHSRYKGMYFIRAIKNRKPHFYNYITSVTHYDRYREGQSAKFPGLYFHYKVSPIVVEYKRDVSFLHFLVELMAILGGVFALGSLIDRLTASSSFVKTPRALQ